MARIVGCRLIFLLHLDTLDEGQPETKIEDPTAAPPGTSMITASAGTFSPHPTELTLESVPAVEASDSVEKGKDAPIVLKEVPPSDDLEYAIMRVTTHAKLLQTSITIHTASGITRLRAAAQCILDGVQDHHRRYSWDALRRRRDFRRTYISALAQKLVTDEATQFWLKPPPGTVQIQKRHELLEKEVPVMDKRFWTSLARWEYRKTVSVVHLCVVFLIRATFSPSC